MKMKFPNKLSLWVFLPLLLVVMLPLWGQIGIWMGYDVFPTPVPDPSHYKSGFPQAFYFTVWTTLLSVVTAPGTMLINHIDAHHQLPPWVQLGAAYLFAPLCYCIVLIAIREAVCVLLRKKTRPAGRTG